MGYIEKTKRNEALLFPEYLDNNVESDCPVRLFDAFVDSLDLEQFGFAKAIPNNVKGYGLGLYYVHSIVEKHGVSSTRKSRMSWLQM